MNCCNRQLFLPLEEDGLTVDGIIIVRLYISQVIYKVIYIFLFAFVFTFITIVFEFVILHRFMMDTCSCTINSLNIPKLYVL